jgi:hypothetical protein
MRRSVKKECVLLVTILFACLCVGNCAREQHFKFIQITDTHLYDDGVLADGRVEREANKAALADAVREINQLVEQGDEFKFVILTGDIGLEKLIAEDVKKLSSVKDARESAKLEREINNKLTGAAMEVASILTPSKVGTWLLLPGNNDLVEEMPETIRHYRFFVDTLRRELKGKQVIDLCPRADDARSGIFELGENAFVGLNDATFKNNDSPRRITDGDDVSLRIALNPTTPAVTPTPAKPAPAAAPPPPPTPDIADEQQGYVRQVSQRINASHARNVYIFHHIPEVDDYHLVLNFDLSAINRRGLSATDGYAFSSWFVDARVRREWEQVVEAERVKGVFAGHYHDQRRETYEGFGWARTPAQLYKGIAKLRVCPPLAVKHQGGSPTQARGFQALTLDAAGNVAVEKLWYDGVARTFSSTAGVERTKLEEQAMKLFEEFVKLIGHLAWPAAVFFVALLLRREIVSVLQSFGKRVADPSSEITLGKEGVTIKKNVEANAGSLESLEARLNVLGALVLSPAKAAAALAPEREEGKDAADKARLTELADAYLRINVSDRAERVRRKNGHATLLCDFVITHNVSKDWLADQAHEGLILALASAVNALPEEGDLERLLKASPRATKLHVKYWMVVAVGYLFERRLAAAADVPRATALLDTYDHDADAALKERITRTRSIIELAAGPPQPAS